MGFVVNKRRFLHSGPAPEPMLIPYSDSSKIVTYLTPGNFSGSDSTSWGDDYPTPIIRSAGTCWDLANDGKSVCVYNENNVSLLAKITPSSQISSFTVYMVAQYNTTSPSGGAHGLTVRNSSNQYAYILIDSSQGTGSNFNSWESGNYSYFITDTTVYEAFQVYAISHPYSGAKPAHILNDKSVKNFSRNGSARPWYFAFDEEFRYRWEYHIKLLAIVSEAESDTVKQNNVNYIRTQLNLT